MKAICIYTAIISIMIFFGCREKGTRNQMPFQNDLPTKSFLNILSEDSSYVSEVNAILAKRSELDEQQIDILLNIASHFISHNQLVFQKHDGFNCSIPVIIEIVQKNDYKGSKNYRVFWSNMGIAKPPTRIERIKDRYIALRLKDGNSLSKNDIPEELLIENCTNDEVVMIYNELSWAVIMCKNSPKHLAVKDIIDEKYLSTVFDEFSCD